MNEARVKVTPLEPLLLRGPGEFDPSARGVTSSAQSIAWPSPSTLAGLLLTHLTKHSSRKASSWPDLLEKYKELMRSSGLMWVRGPYFIDEEKEIYVPLLLGDFILVNLRQLRYYFKELLRGLEKHGDISKVTRYLRKHSKKTWYQERVVISLRSREGVKTVREGFLYSTTLACFQEGSFAVEIGIKNDVSSLSNRAAVFGGEGRVVRIEVDSEKPITEELSKFKGGYVLLLSPLIIPAASPTLVRKDGKALVVVTGRQLIAELLIGRVGIRGLGYAMAEHVRKPIYPAILEGSILRLEECSNDVKTYSAYACLPSQFWAKIESLAMLGFGSFVPLES